MSQKRAANAHFLCPKCGKRKGYNSRHCQSCRFFPATKSKPGDRILTLIKLLGSGATIKEIACAFGISSKTVEYHWAQAKAQFGFQCYQDVTKYAIKHKLIAV